MSEFEQELALMKGYLYQIWKYQRGHSEITILAKHDRKASHCIRLTFTNLGYIQSPLEWKGDLYLASDKELREIIKRTEYGANVKNIPLEIIKKLYSLYKADLSYSKVYILGKLLDIEYDVDLSCLENVAA